MTTVEKTTDAAAPDESEYAVTSYRDFSGVCVEGRKISIRLIPNGTNLGQIGVQVLAHNVLTGYGSSCRLDRDGTQTSFTPTSISFVDDTMMCLEDMEGWGVYREGFMVNLEPGMRGMIETLLPSLAQIASVGASISDRIALLAGERTHVHMNSFIFDLLAMIILDEMTVTNAMDLLRTTHWAGQEQWYIDTFADPSIADALQSVQR